MNVRLLFGAQMQDDNGELRTLSDEELYGVLMPFFTRLATANTPPEVPPLLAQAVANCHVGPYESRPTGVDELPAAYRRLDPAKHEFELIRSIPFDFWTNNPHIVDEFPADRVLVCGVPLTRHPDWPRWQQEMTAGEFWSMVGNAWANGTCHLHLRQFTTTPGPRLRGEGANSAEEFREAHLLPLLQNALGRNEVLNVVLDGVAGVASSFLEEAFGGLARRGMPQRIGQHLTITCTEDPALAREAEGYLRDALAIAKVAAANVRILHVPGASEPVDTENNDPPVMPQVGDTLKVVAVDPDDDSATLEDRHGNTFYFDLG